MSFYEFIFSEKFSQRIHRHLIFWLVIAMHIFVFRFYVFDLRYLSYSATYLIRFKDLLFFLPVSVFYAYFAIYLLLPKYILKAKYGRLLIIVFISSLVLIFFSWFLSSLFNIKLAWDMPLNRADVLKKIDFTFNNGLIFPLMVSAFAIGIKMSKKFYLQQKQNQLLAKQKINAEVQLLKGQVHPIFLFNALNSIYNDMLNGSGHSPEMLLKLSDLLSYILYESGEMMPLEKELSLLKNYIDLEKLNYGSRLDVTIRDKTLINNKSIEPLLLLPIAEYAFERFNKNNPQKIFLNLGIAMKEDIFQCIFTISGKLKVIENSFNENIHFMQVQKRLNKQYPGKHTLKVTNFKDASTISLTLTLDEMSSTNLSDT